jgi:CubicO group peptidase (beta-lactamase class C family)
MRKALACLALLAALTCVPVAAQDTPVAAPTAPPFDGEKARAIDAIAQGEIKSGSTPGMAVGVVEDGLLVYARGFGIANIAMHRNVAAGTEFYAGSIAKQFTAASILLLAQDKKLSLSDKVGKYIPELRIARNVTISQLLHQSSGLPDYTSAPGVYHDPTRPVKVDDLIKAVDRMEPAFAPGTKFAYNNFNYMVATLIIERVSGVPFSVFLQSHIFEPLIMTSSFLAGDEGISPRRAYGYTRIKGKFERTKAWDASWLLGSGDLVTNVDDLAKWDIGLPLLLNIDSVREMWSTDGTPSSQYGMGWIIDQRGGQRFLWHNGEVAGYHSMNALLPEQHVAVIVLTNADGLHEDSTVEPERIANSILDVVDPLPPAHFANLITERATEWLGRLAQNQIDRTQLSPSFSQYLTDRVIERADLKQLGPALSLVPIESFQRSGDTVYIFDAKFRRVTYRYQFILAADGKIDGLYLQP